MSLSLDSWILWLAGTQVLHLKTKKRRRRSSARAMWRPGFEIGCQLCCPKPECVAGNVVLPKHGGFGEGSEGRGSCAEAEAPSIGEPFRSLEGLETFL